MLEDGLMGEIDLKSDTRLVLRTLTSAAFVLILIGGALGQGLQPVDMVQVRGQAAGGPTSWTAESFGWFFYDMADGKGSERIEIQPIGRLVDKGRIIYTCRAVSKEFEHERWGSYQWISFLGRSYFAGYPDNPFTEAVSSIEDGELREILIDVDTKVLVTTNQSLPLAGGYSLALAGVSDHGDEVHLILLKDSVSVYSAIVRNNDDFAFKVGADDLPVIVAHVLTAMRGSNESVVELDGIFQISDEASIVLSDGMVIDEMEVTDISSDRIEMRNRMAITLIQDRIIPLADRLFVRVADQPYLSYYPVGLYADYMPLMISTGQVISGKSLFPYNILGVVPTHTEAVWDAGTFTGFYFDDELNIGTETLLINGTRDRTLPAISIMPVQDSPLVTFEGVLYYSTVQEKEFERKDWGKYEVMSLFGNLWFAGYSMNTSKDIGNKSMIEYEKLGRVLIDTDARDISRVGEGWNLYTLKEGYTLAIADVGEKRVLIALFKDGRLVDNSTVEENSTYVYKKDVGDNEIGLVEDLPIIILHIGEIFRDQSQRIAEIDGLFQISDQDYIPVDAGRKFGEMKVIGLTPSYVLFGNDESLTLKKDSSVLLWPEIPGYWKVMSIEVADNETLRYRPFTLNYVLPPPRIVGMVLPQGTVSGFANFTVAVQAGDVRQVLAEIMDSNGRSVSMKDLTSLANGYSDRWTYSWSWDASVPVLSDDRSTVPDSEISPTSAVLYRNGSSRPVPVGVTFDLSGRISGIVGTDGTSYFVAPDTFSRIVKNISFQEMLNNTTMRERFIKIEPDVSRIGFFPRVNGTTKGQINHTISGTLSSIEPHIEKVPVPPGNYTLRISAANPMGSVIGIGFFNLSTSGLSPWWPSISQFSQSQVAGPENALTRGDVQNETGANAAGLGGERNSTATVGSAGSSKDAKAAPGSGILLAALAVASGASLVRMRSKKR